MWSGDNIDGFAQRDNAGAKMMRAFSSAAIMAQAPIVPVHYSGPADIRLVHLITRPKIVVRFGPIVAVGVDTADRQGAARLTSRLDGAIKALADRES